MRKPRHHEVMSFVPSTFNIAAYLWDFLDDRDTAIAPDCDRHCLLGTCTPRPETAQSTV